MLTRLFSALAVFNSIKYGVASPWIAVSQFEFSVCAAV